MYGKLIDGEIEYKNFKNDEDAFAEGYKMISNMIPEHNPISERTEIIGYEEEQYTIYAIHKVIPNTLDEVKKIKIERSKILLAEFIESHPITSNCKYEDGRVYTITSEKQQQLASKLLMATMYSQLNIPYDLTWNSRGNECEPYTFEQLFTLSGQIDSVVTKLVGKQQELECEINRCESIEEVIAIEIKYEVDY